MFFINCYRLSHIKPNTMTQKKETKDLPLKEQVKKYWGENSRLKNGESEDEWYERRKAEINRFRSGY